MGQEKDSLYLYTYTLSMGDPLKLGGTFHNFNQFLLIQDMKIYCCDKIDANCLSIFFIEITRVLP